MMYKIAPKEFEALRQKAGNICQANSGQPCEDLHGTEFELKDEIGGGQVMVVHAVNENKENIIADDTEIMKAGGESMADYAQWVIDNVKPSGELT